MKKTLTSATIFLTALLTWGFDWPQNEIMSDTFFTYFGQKRADCFSTSLVFSGSTDIKAAEEGHIAAVLSEHDEESELFESTLGNAVLISHKDGMMTVYANLSSEQQEDRFKLRQVENGENLGNCGLSGWQEGNALLEFQVIDTENKVFVNPRVLMPRFGNELPLTITGVTAVNKKGTVFDLNTQKVLAKGTYCIYREKQPVAMPYKTTVFVNGAAADTIIYDTLTQKNGRLCTSGNKNYPSSMVYPDSKRHLLAEITIPKGRNKITITAQDILGREKTITYTVDAY